MDDKIATDLKAETPSRFHQQILEDTKALVAMSRRKMSDYYSQWDRNDDVYRSIRKRDKEDVSAAERREPEKMVVPISYAQIQTFVTFCFSLFTQRDRFFELEGFTADDARPAEIGEALLARDLDKNVFEAVLFQFLLDIARFGLGILKTTWVTEQQMVEKTVTTPAKTFLGVTYAKESTETVREFGTSYMGNRIISISPYRFFPDVRLPLVRFQEGEFCASEDIYTVSRLKQWEREGVVAGVDFIKPLGKEVIQERTMRMDLDLDPGGSLSVGAGLKGDGQAKKTVIVTECQRNIIPSQYEVDGQPIGDEDYPVKYVIWIANDTRVIKCEPMNYLHNEFTYQVAPFIFDNNILVSEGLADIIDPLQSVISWFLNSRITNVRKVIGDKLVVNPAMVNMKDLQERRPVIRLTAAASGEIDRYLKQLQLVDVTASHVSDVKELHDILKMVTGINDSLLGEVRPGRRSATENRNSTSGASSRQRVLASIIFRASLEPLGRQMLSNLRDGLDEEVYVKLLGMKAMATPEFIQVDKTDLVGHYDFELFDGTLPSERIFAAQALEETLKELLSNPQLAMMFGLDPKKLLFESLRLRGVKNPERFEMDQVQQQQMLALMAQQQQAAAQTAPGGQNGGNGEDGAGVSGAVPTNGGPGATTTGLPTPVGKPVLPTLGGMPRG